MSRILVVSEYTVESQNSTGYFWQKAITKLREDGLDVVVITPDFELRGQVRHNVILRALLKLKTALGLGWRTFRLARKDDIVFSGTNPELLLCILAILRRLRGFRWRVLVHDVFPENLVPAGVLRSQSFIYRVFEALFGWVYAQADTHVVIGRDMKDLVEGKAGSKGRTEFIPNWVDGRSVKALDKSGNSIVQRLGLQGKTVFQFFGNIGRLQGIQNILAAIPLVRSEDAAFLFIGEGVGSERVMEFVKNNPGAPVHYAAALPQAEKEGGLSACDVAIICLEKGMYGLGVPSKAYFTLAADRPIFAVMDPGSEIALMVEEDKVGWTCPPDDPKLIAEHIDRICSMELSAYRGRMRQVLESKYSPDISLAKLSAVIQS
jgi:glycosyltransferase involved in cell wall biosynthesis